LAQFAHEVDHAGVFNFPVAPNEDFPGLGFQGQFAERGGPVLGGHFLFIHEDPAIRVEADDKGILRPWHGLAACFRQVNFNPAHHEGSGDHKNDQEDQHNVDKGSYVNVGDGPYVLAAVNKLFRLFHFKDLGLNGHFWEMVI
jgi:hypothetical protein